MSRILILVIFVTLTFDMSVGQQQETSAKSYMEQKTERQKLDYVITLMSNEKIKRGSTLAELKHIFGKDLMKIDALTPDGERQYGITFRERLPNKDDRQTQARRAKDISWGVTFHIDAADRVSFYYLSNIPK